MSPTHTAELLRAARALTRLQLKARKLRKELKNVQREIRIEQKLIRVLDRESRPQSAPSRLFGDGIGHVYEHEHNTKALSLDDLPPLADDLHDLGKRRTQ